MATNGDIYLGVTGDLKLLSPFGRKLQIKQEQIVREGRTINGRLVRDVITTKNEISLSYELIGGTDLTTLLTLYALDLELTLKIYKDSGYDSYTVLMDPISRQRELLASDGLWGGVTVTLKEV